MTTWIEALKIWNGRKGGSWCVPRRGSVEHSQVMDIKNGGTPSPAPVKKEPKKQNIKFKKKATSFKYTKEEAKREILKITNRLGAKKKKELNDFISERGIERLFYVSPPNYNSIGRNIPIDMSEKMTEQLKEIWKNSPLNDEAKHHSYKWMYQDVGPTPNELSTNKQLRSGFPFKSEYVNASRDKLILENRFRDQKKYFEKREKLKEKNLKAGRKVDTKQFDKQTDKGLDKINDKYGLLDKFRYNGHIKQTLKRMYKPIIDDNVDVMGVDNDIYATQRKQVKKYKYNQYGRGQSGGEIINPNVDLITEINNLWTGLIGMGMNQTQKNKLKKRVEGGMIDPRDISLVSRMSRDINKRAKQKGGLGWAEMTAVNEVLYPLQPKLPSLDTKTGKPVPPSTPFDFLNITF